MNAKKEKRDLRKVYDNAYRSIAEMVAPLQDDETADDEREKAVEAIREDILSVEVRLGWGEPGAPMAAEEFRLLLSTGGPAVRIVGELDQHGEPNTARLEVQDWFEPWTDFQAADETVLLTYCSVFYFGDS